MAMASDDFSDLAELGIDVHLEDVQYVNFDKCVKHIQSIAGSLDNSTLLQCYGLYKQSIEGPCNTPKPPFYDLKAKAKWQAWKSLGNIDKTEAMRSYIDLVLKISPQLNFDQNEKTDSWVKVSSMVRDLTDLGKTISDHIRNSDIAKVTDYLNSNSDLKDELDSNGMGLLHYAADIGSPEILNILLSHGLSVNFQDCDGQTALHYASSCGHKDCVQLLLNKGANPNVPDSEGYLPVNAACDDSVRKLFK